MYHPSIIFVSFLFSVASAHITPSIRLHIESYNGNKTGQHIVKLKSSSSSRTWIARLGLKNAAEWENFSSFAAQLSVNNLETLRMSPEVESISEDGIVQILAQNIQTDAPWGVARISSTTALSSKDTSVANFNYTFDDSAGGCADIYIVDTGVKLDHHDFGGRATWGYPATGAQTDANGHGTHCAGTAAGTRYGVAKKAKISAVKVLSDSGSGSVSDIIAGLNWVMSNVQKTGRPSVVNMSIGGSANTALDNAVTSMTNAGIHVVVAAGNSNTDAGGFSPGRVPSVITVGGTTINDVAMITSNYGAVVDIWAPGQNIISDWISGPDSTNIISGTSSSAAHVSGLVAYLLCKEGAITPAQMSTKLKAYCIPLSSTVCLAHNAPH